MSTPADRRSWCRRQAARSELNAEFWEVLIVAFPDVLVGTYILTEHTLYVALK